MMERELRKKAEQLAAAYALKCGVLQGNVKRLVQALEVLLAAAEFEDAPTGLEIVEAREAIDAAREQGL